MTKDEIKNQLEEDLRGDCCCDYITKKEMMEYLDDLDKWLETAKNGDVYFYDGQGYELKIEYEIAVWRNKEIRDIGEPIYMTPTCSNTDLDAIKAECEHYDIESSGCIEIFETGSDDAILHFENDEWTDVVN